MMTFDEWWKDVENKIPFLIRDQAKAVMYDAYQHGYLQGHEDGRVNGYEAGRHDGFLAGTNSGTGVTL